MKYVTEVADLFLRLNPEVTILSAADYSTIAEWEKQEIPLWLVLASISKACVERKNKTIETGDITCLRETIKTDFDMWLNDNRDSPA